MTTLKRKIRVPKQKRSIEKKNAIILAAIELFSEKGIHNTNSREIVSKAGVSVGSFYSYFSDKKALFIEVLEYYLENHFAMIWQQDNELNLIEFSKEIISSYLSNLLRAYAIAPEFHRQTHALRYTDPDVKALYDKEFEKEIQNITGLLTFFSESLGAIDYDAAAVIIHSSCENLAHTIFYKTTHASEKELKDEFVNMIYHWLVKKPPMANL